MNKNERGKEINYVVLVAVVIDGIICYNK